MFYQDQKIIELKVTRNALETYVYDYRAYLDTYGDRAKYMTDADREAFLGQLNSAEEWLYNDG